MPTSDLLVFPSARPGRTGPGPSSSATPSAAPALPPRTRVFPFAINQTAGTRHSVFTPKILGPAIILDFTINQGTRAEPVNNSWEIGWASVPGGENGVLLTTPRPYTVLTELLDPANIVVDTVGGGVLANTLSAPNTTFPIPLGIIIDAAEIYVVVADVNPSGFAQHIYGHIRVLEAVPRDTLLAFH